MAYATINKPTEHFNTVLYTGNGSTQSITGVGFQPDFTWIKARDGATNYYHYLQDAVRGSLNVMFTNNADEEATYTQSITSFDSDGFSTGNQPATNDNGDNFVAWNWLAGNGTVSNTEGSITSTVSANTTAGFSIVNYTGSGASASFGHGLTSPKVVIIKDRSASNTGWYLHTTVIDGSDDYLYLNQTDVKSDAGSGYSVGTSVFNLGGAGGVTNLNGNNYLAYCFQEIKGFSKIGIYKANGNADGPFVYTGFKPAFIIAKDTDSTQGWIMLDNKRPAFNERTKALAPHLGSLEFDSQANVGTDFLSNGFKIRAVATGDLNYANGRNYFYIAFAEQTLVGTNNITATAV